MIKDRLKLLVKTLSFSLKLEFARKVESVREVLESGEDVGFLIYNLFIALFRMSGFGFWALGRMVFSCLIKNVRKKGRRLCLFRRVETLIIYSREIQFTPKFDSFLFCFLKIENLDLFP